MRGRGASVGSQEDGELGIDNAFGRAVLPLLAPFVPDLSRRSAGRSYLRVDPDRTGVLVVVDAIQTDYSIVVPLSDVRIDGDTKSGTLSALVPVEAFVRPSMCVSPVRMRTRRATRSRSGSRTRASAPTTSRPRSRTAAAEDQPVRSQPCALGDAPERAHCGMFK